MDKQDRDILQKIAHTVRALSADAIETARSGHPGLPLGAAELGAYLFARELRYNPRNPSWMGRDRFILSAGHGSMLLYSLLHLSGYDLDLNQIRSFRQLHSLTPGHPEFGETPGVETTTGPLGQGIAAATGMAIAQKLLAARFDPELFDSKIWVLAGDGCMMEGISAEAGSLAGTLGLHNMVIIYDSNQICLDGPTAECMLENTCKRYEAYGFQVLEIDGHDFDQIENAFGRARQEDEKPVLIIARTIIGKHMPNRQGRSISHGKFLGPEEMRLFKQAINWPHEPLFYIPDQVRQYFINRQQIFSAYEEQWQTKFEKLIGASPEKLSLWNQFMEKRIPDDFEEQIWNLEISPDQPTRKYNEAIIAHVAKTLPYLISGSADVASVDYTWLPHSGIISASRWNQQQIKFGVREFSMAACAYGMNLFGMLQPTIGTFLTFSDYMRNAIRLAAMMKQRVIFVFTHDSIMLAQDGPTHQPVEHLMSLRLMPNLTLIRPGDENESKAAWAAAFRVQDQPVALCFTRQPIKSTVSHLTAGKARKGVQLGAYILFGEEADPVDVEIFATGSEIHPAVGAAKMLEKEGLGVRVVSVPSWELFRQQDDDYQQTILGTEAGLKVSVEAGTGLGWQYFVGKEGLIISQEIFGASAPEPVMVDYFGFTKEKVYKRIKNALRQIKNKAETMSNLEK
jgi:transketolase